MGRVLLGEFMKFSEVLSCLHLVEKSQSMPPSQVKRTELGVDNDAKPLINENANDEQKHSDCVDQ
jgi:hypothetical protein